MVKFCPNCGFRMNTNASFCMECGAKISDYAVDNSSVTVDAVNVSRDNIQVELEEILAELTTNIKIVGCGNAGGRIVEYILRGSITGRIKGAELITVDTDAQYLMNTQSSRKILIGRKKTRGLGAGSLPQIGEDAALESLDEISATVKNADMVFITAGLGGGTGTGSAPVVAEAARDAGALTIAVVTLPFGIEGEVRRTNAEAGLEKLRNVADTVIVVPNDKLLEIVPRLPLQAAFEVSNEILMRVMKGITESIIKPSLVNLDFADVRTVMNTGDVAMIGLGEADGKAKAIESALKALRSPLLDVDISDGTSVLINVVGGPDMTIAEAESVVQEVYSRIDPDAQLIWSAQVDDSLEYTVRTMIIATNICLDKYA